MLVIAVFPVVGAHAGPEQSNEHIHLLDGHMYVLIRDTTVLYSSIPLSQELYSEQKGVSILDKVDCNSTMSVADNCRDAAASGGSEFTRTCMKTPQMLNDSGVRSFRGPSGDILASMEVNSKLLQAVLVILVLCMSGVQMLYQVK